MGSREVRGSVFVGREEELRLLAAELAEAAAGRGRPGRDRGRCRDRKDAGRRGIHGACGAAVRADAVGTLPGAAGRSCPTGRGSRSFAPTLPRRAIGKRWPRSRRGAPEIERVLPALGNVLPDRTSSSATAPTSGVSACSTRSPRSCAARRNAPRSSSSSTICTGPIRGRSSSWGFLSASFAACGCCCCAPTGRSRSIAAGARRGPGASEPAGAAPRAGTRRDRAGRSAHDGREAGAGSAGRYPAHHRGQPVLPRGAVAHAGGGGAREPRSRIPPIKLPAELRATIRRRLFPRRRRAPVTRFAACRTGVRRRAPPGRV